MFLITVTDQFFLKKILPFFKKKFDLKVLIHDLSFVLHINFTSYFKKMFNQHDIYITYRKFNERKLSLSIPLC